MRPSSPPRSLLHFVLGVAVVAAAAERIPCREEPLPPLVACPQGQSCPFEQVHISIGRWQAGAGWEMTVTWTSQALAAGQVPSVRVSERKETLTAPSGCVADFVGETTNYTYTSSGGPFYSPSTKFYVSPSIHHVVIGKLRPSKFYHYQVGVKQRKAIAAGNDQYRDTVFRFRTPPAPGQAPSAQLTGSEVMKIVVIGDLGQTIHSQHTMEKVESSLRASENSYAMSWIIGDLPYADGDGHRWDPWGRMMEPASASLPLMVLPGNHEIELDAQTAETFTAYRHRFRMPSQLPERTGPARGNDILYEGGASFYSFELGLVHFVCLNTYNTRGAMHDVSSDVQRKWLEEDLKAVDRRKTPFVVVGMHAPFYNSNRNHQGEAETELMKSWAEQILNRYSVDVVFAGHVHSYERNWGVATGGKLSSSAPSYINVGDGGNHEGLYDDWLPQPPYSAYRNGKFFGHGELSVFNASHMRWTWIPNPKQGEQEEDSVWIVRPVSSGSKQQQQQDTILTSGEEGRNPPSPMSAALPLTLLGFVLGAFAYVISKRVTREERGGGSSYEVSSAPLLKQSPADIEVKAESSSTRLMHDHTYA
ncbi:hypothetical protein GUITHDRAFT_165854 [Guillardia theta CCMP2712]|uniref:Purple acid phosphatase n=2 Tax=Guillardia theta TaxID=55529 RepID=L1IIC8_GUITC|nr:hypothetical protein GUITHDRAFT_165854 [Guillardia theta CCMP2712]EKX35981.1 hypothetical protein GUITHDRAFT_165854 [Guillardia theta CCMP2712]|eukprot:XP_005822961.1 hypothetical protein GUITHDRAFT_165854 [Guillardia theta CCMP2712]